METCYVVAERFSSADLLHGPIAMLEASFPAFLFAPAGVTWPGMREMVQKLAQLKAETLLITDPGNAEAQRLGANAITLPIPSTSCSRRFPTSSPRSCSPPSWPSRKV